MGTLDPLDPINKKGKPMDAIELIELIIELSTFGLIVYYMMSLLQRTDY